MRGRDREAALFARLIRLDPVLSRDEIYRIFEELVPERERGKKSGREDLTRAGHSVTTTMQFENVCLQIVSDELPRQERRDHRGRYRRNNSLERHKMSLSRLMRAGFTTIAPQPDLHL